MATTIKKPVPGGIAGAIPSPKPSATPKSFSARHPPSGPYTFEGASEKGGNTPSSRAPARTPVRTPARRDSVFSRMRTKVHGTPYTPIPKKGKGNRRKTTVHSRHSSAMKAKKVTRRQTMATSSRTRAGAMRANKILNTPPVVKKKTSRVGENLKKLEEERREQAEKLRLKQQRAEENQRKLQHEREKKLKASASRRSMVYDRKQAAKREALALDGMSRREESIQAYKAKLDAALKDSMKSKVEEIFGVAGSTSSRLKRSDEFTLD
eukprot:CAMPEP_0170195278 /NCGR_PEP_ID=MMETSP0040_2-20121228/61177_1 /TAXON_ID=641309 /ORGANISM="Lotharella oceanica, Strain CCMP622" /LENGTH=265 /DNA_ID=CAMNT_0010444403 /DNA_START=71 /DNA_END=868 /DNA_ORIENTATION=+